MTEAEALRTAQAHHQRGQLDKAGRLYAEILRKHPRSSGALGGLALIAYQRDEYAKAAELFERALTLTPGDPGLLLNWGNCLQAQGQLEQATEAFRRATEAGPFPEAHVNLGNALCSRGLVHEAIPQYRRALQLRPTYPRALRRLALALASEACQAEEHSLLMEASACLNAVLAQGGGDEEIRTALARCDWRLARYARDLARFGAALARLGGAEQVHARKEYARLALDLGDPSAVGALGEPPPGWRVQIAQAAASTWSASRPLTVGEERDGVLLTGIRDWLVLRSEGSLRFEDMTNADPEAGQYVRAISPGRRILAAIPEARDRLACDAAVLIGGQPNYYHWLMDYLPRLRLVLDTPELAALPLVVNDVLAPFQHDTFKALGVDAGRLLPVATGRAMAFKRLVVPDLGALHQQVHPDTLDWLRRVFGPDGAGAVGRKLWVSRNDASLRRVANEDEVLDALVPKGFERIVIGTMGVSAQAELFAAADVIVAPHGAALTNLAFCRPDTRVVELMPGRHQQLGFFPALSAQCGLAHSRLVCEPRPTPEQECATSPQNFDMLVPIGELLAVL
jgi:capsular polysaccharide biosynthesis protein/Tfp pilus assembly protein PilF